MMQSDTGRALAFLLKLSPSPTSKVAAACLLQNLKEAKQARRPQFRGEGVSETSPECSGWVLQTWVPGAESKNSPSPHGAICGFSKIQRGAQSPEVGTTPVPTELPYPCWASPLLSKPQYHHQHHRLRVFLVLTPQDMGLPT